MRFPSFDTFFIPLIHSLRARGGSATIDELEEAVSTAANLSDEQRAQLHGDGPRTEFSYRLAWARTYLKKGGALENSERGVWHLTPAGYEMSDQEIREIKYQVQQQNRADRAAAALAANNNEEEEENDVEEITLPWKEILLETLLALEPWPAPGSDDTRLS
ncbi:MAG: hypothetical protein GC182_23140 [Rhodopseudomonas sp.]|nr:hypothetical protein [Rhodopseudomonas sp.]